MFTLHHPPHSPPWLLCQSRAEAINGSLLLTLSSSKLARKIFAIYCISNASLIIVQRADERERQREGETEREREEELSQYLLKPKKEISIICMCGFLSRFFFFGFWWLILASLLSRVLGSSTYVNHERRQTAN